MSKEKGVAIRIKLGTRNFLKDSGVKGETYDDVINRLFNEGAEAKNQLVFAWAKLEALLREREEAEG